MENLREIYVQLVRFGDALRIVQENLDAKNYYAYNPELDVQPVPIHSNKMHRM